MAYMIQKLAKAHYVCMNIECDGETLAETRNRLQASTMPSCAI
jgi:ribosomal protein S6